MVSIFYSLKAELHFFSHIVNGLLCLFDCQNPVKAEHGDAAETWETRE